MNSKHPAVRWAARAGTVVAATLGALFVANRASADESRVLRTITSVTADSEPAAAAATAASPVLEDTLFGRSGKLRFRLLEPSRTLTLPALARLFGDSAVSVPGRLYAVRDSLTRSAFSFITLVPFASKSGARLGTYNVGFWPGERRKNVSDAYANPDGFITVTPENQDTYISEHFRLRDFLTKDQHRVWPKYLVLREELIDKLELVIADLERNGVDVKRMRVMSGFRTPQYNGPGGNGRSSVSRHMYGDAADVFIDNNGDDRMDDLNRDGRVNSADAAVILRAVERVEQRYPDLVGGVGVYTANRAHGPCAPVDVRGRRARWGNS